MGAIAWREVGVAFTHFPIDHVFIALVPLGAAILMRAARWWVLLRGDPISFTQVLVSQNAGIGLNNMLPVRVGSEAFQLGLVTKRYGIPLPRALASLVGGNVLDIFATGILMAVGVALIPGLRDTKLGIQLFGAIVMLVVSLLVMVGVSRGMGSIPIANKIGFFHRVIGSLEDLKDSPGRLGLSFGATFSHWILMGVGGWVLASGLGMSVDALTMASILVGATFFTSAMLSLPGGAGTYHFAIVSMLTALGEERELAFIFALVMHLLVFIPPMVVAFFVMSRLGADAIMHHTREVRAEQTAAQVAKEPVVEGSPSRS